MITINESDIERIEEIDEGGDISWIGDYTDKIPLGREITRGDVFERRERSFGEYKYFVPAHSVPEIRKDLIRMGYSRGEAERMAREQCRQDYELAEQYASGLLWFIGIRARTRIVLPMENNCSIIHDIESPGIWGISSDSPESEKDNIYETEKYLLIKMLEQLNVKVIKEVKSVGA